MSTPLLDDAADLTSLRAKGADPDELFASFAEWAEASGTVLYPAQEEALIELVSGANVVLATPTGSGKSLVATGAQYAALAAGRRSYYTAPIKALVSEKFFALCGVVRRGQRRHADRRRGVNHDAPIIACTAEVLANIALREGADADIGLVVMDEFHFYGDPDRGWAWQVPLLELPKAQFLLMSATLGDVTRSCARTSPAAPAGPPRWSPTPSARCRCTTTTRRRRCTRRSRTCWTRSRPRSTSSTSPRPRRWSARRR